MAVSGSTMTSVWGGKTTAALTNIPGSRVLSGLRIVAWIVIVRVSALTCGSIVVISAVKGRPGDASAGAFPRCPTAIPERVWGGAGTLTYSSDRSGRGTLPGAGWGVC